ATSYTCSAYTAVVRSGTLHATQLADGDHTFMVVAVNSRGNTTSSLPYNWTVDAAAPAAPTVSGPAALVKSGTADFSYADTSADATSYTCSVDGGAESG